jgi:very-short-patch-repair endonuclease
VICQFCGKECKNANSHRNHERTCPKNPNRNYKNGMTGKTPWNKGLDKSDPRVAQQARSLSATTKGIAPNYEWTAERRKKKSEWKKQRHANDPNTHPNRLLAGNRNRWTYPERVAAEWFDANKIVYERNKKVGKFYPDFVIGNIIVEIDGERWHDTAKDAIRDSNLNDLGYVVHRIKSKEKIWDRLNELFGA